jgi:glucodextranase-like protein
MAQDKDKPGKGAGADDLLDWFTVSYRSIYAAVALVLVLAAGYGYWYWKGGGSKPPLPQPSAEPTASAGAQGASFEDFDGSVQVKKAGQLEWIPATKQMVLNQDDRVRTGSGAGAAIRLASGIMYRMKADSLMTIEREGVDAVNKRPGGVTAALQSGGVNFSTGAASATITTPLTRTTTGQNTQGEVAVGQSGESVAKVFSGSATTETAKGDKVDLRSNEAVLVDAAGKSGAKTTMPGVPVLMAPPHQSEISYVNPALSLTLLVWKGPPNATYHILVDFTPSFNRPLVDQKGWKLSSLELRGLEVGKYYWKVAAVDASGLEGSPSELAFFSVTKPSPGQQGQDTPPTLTLDALEPKSNILHVKGRTAPGASLTVNGQRVDVQNDGTFNEFITLDKPGKQIVVIRATSIGGGVTEEKRPVVVTY